MSRNKPDLASGWLRAEELVDREADRLATMADDEFQREMRGEPRPARVPTVERLLARKGERGEAREPEGSWVERVGARRPWRQWAVWLAVGVLVIVLAIGALVGRPLLAWIPGARLLIGPDPGDLPAAARAQAAALRTKAFEACDNHRWADCTTGLDTARAIDPRGERDPRVEAARRTLDAEWPPPKPK